MPLITGPVCALRRRSPSPLQWTAAKVIRLLSSSVLLAALVVLPIRSGAAGEHWPQFRGPDGNGHADATGLPLVWSETQNVRWKTPIHDRGWSSPVVWGRQIWLTTATSDGKRMYAVCVDHQSGRVLRDIKLFDVPEPDEIHLFNSYASPTPVIARSLKNW